jgi:hypothetical protein
MQRSDVRPSRRTFLGVASGVAAFLGAPAVLRHAMAAPPEIRYSTGGGIGPNEMETVIFLDWMRENVLKRHGKDYTLSMTFARSTAEAATPAGSRAGGHRNSGDADPGIGRAEERHSGRGQGDLLDL